MRILARCHNKGLRGCVTLPTFGARPITLIESIASFVIWNSANEPGLPLCAVLP